MLTQSLHGSLQILDQSTSLRSSMYGSTYTVLDTLLSVLEEESLHRSTLPKSTQLPLPSLVLLMHHLEMMLRRVDRLLAMSLCSIACQSTGKQLYFDQSLDLLLRLSYTLSQPLALSRNTRIDSAATLALRFLLRRPSGVTMHRLYA